MVTAAMSPRDTKREKIDKILNDMRQHLEKALGNDSIKGLTFSYDINNGGVRRNDVEVLVKYHYVNTAIA